MAIREKTAARQTKRVFFGWYLARRNGQWSGQQRLKVACNTALFGDDASRRKHIENTIASTFKLDAADVCCVRFRSTDGVFEWSADADDVVARTATVAKHNPTPVPTGDWIAEMSAEDIREAVRKFTLPAADFDGSHTLAELRQNLAFALHGTATDSE